MESKYIIKEESVNYIFGTAIDGSIGISTAKRYVVYEVDDESEVCMNESGWLEEGEKPSEPRVAIYIDNKFNERQALFCTLEQAKLFTEGKIGVLMSKDV